MKIKEQIEKEIEDYKKDPKTDLKLKVSLSIIDLNKLQAIESYEKEILEMIDNWYPDTDVKPSDIRKLKSKIKGEKNE